MDPARIIALVLIAFMLLGAYLIGSGSVGFGVTLILLVIGVIAFVMSARI